MWQRYRKPISIGYMSDTLSAAHGPYRREALGKTEAVGITYRIEVSE